MCRKFKKALGCLAKDWIIIDTISGKYSVIGGNENMTDITETPEGSNKRINVLKFDKQVFSKNVECRQIKTSAYVASLVSSQRFNTENKLSILILNDQNIIRANIHLEYSVINVQALIEDIILYSTHFGGTQAIVYGRTAEFHDESTKNKVNELHKELKAKANVNLIQFLNSKYLPDLDLIKKN
jgi:hypothetical protein